MTTLKPWHKLLHSTQFWELASEKWEQTRALKVNCTENNQDDADQTTALLILRWLSELTMLFCFLPPLIQSWNSPLRTPVPWAAIGSWFSGRSPPSPLVAGLWNKANFPFLPILVSQVLAFEQWAAGPRFGNSILQNFKGFWKLLPINFWNHFQKLFHGYLYQVSDHKRKSLVDAMNKVINLLMLKGEQRIKMMLKSIFLICWAIMKY